MKICVLGGHGFIGGALATRLERLGHEVFRRSRRTGLDLMQPDSLREWLGGSDLDVIFNCAAHVGSIHYVMKNAALVASDNIQMAVNLYRAVAEISPGAHIINPLSNCSYPGDADVHYEPDWLKGEPHHSVFAYANAKRFVYVLARCYREQFDVRTTNFLVPNAFGVGDHVDTNRTHALSGMIVRMIQAKERRESRFEVWGSGQPVREWGYIDDIVEILVRALDLKEDLTFPVNIAQNCGVSIRASAEAIKEAVRYQGDLWFNTNYEDGAPRKVLDDRRFRQLFPGHVFIDHADAIRRTVAYYEEALASDRVAVTG